MFCPFIKGECNDECMYRGGNVPLPDDCDLYDAIKTLQSLQLPNNAIDNRMQELASSLSSIDSNTSSDQTDSYRILSEVRDILELLKKHLGD